MQPPRHVCEALYRLDPDLRLCYLGVPFEHGATDQLEEAEEGCFGVAILVPWAQVEDAEGKRKTLKPVVPYDMPDRGVRVFSRTGRPVPDYDSLTQAPVLFTTVSSQWGMSTHDVYGSRLLHILRNSRKSREERRKQRIDALKEKGKERYGRVQEMASEIGKAMHYDVTRSGFYDGTETREDRIARRKKREARKALNVGVENTHLLREGLI